MGFKWASESAEDDEGKCVKCGSQGWKNGATCSGCRYHWQYEHEKLLDPQDRDWSFTSCEECGSTLHEDGQCYNTSCGNSPFQGSDWV